MFFDFVVETSIISSFLVLFIFLIQKIFKNSIAPNIGYYLWLIVILKLVIPINIQSELSLERFINVKPKVQEIKYNEVAAEVKETEEINQNNILEYLWFSGVSIISCYGLFLYIKLKASLKNSKEITDLQYINILKSCRKNLNIKSEVKLLEVDFIESPSIVGGIKPIILIPSKLLNKISEKNIRYIFLHELTHFKCGDIFINLLLQGVRVVYFFNPIIFFATMKVKEECELACDFRVLKKLGKDEFKNYGNALIDLSVNEYKREYIPLSVGMSMNKNELKRRILMIGKNNKFDKKHLIAGFGALLMVGAVGLTTYAADENDTKNEGNAVIEEATGDVGKGIKKGEKIIEDVENIKVEGKVENVIIDANGNEIITNGENEVILFEDNEKTGEIKMRVLSKEEAEKYNEKGVIFESSSSNEK